MAHVVKHRPSMGNQRLQIVSWSAVDGESVRQRHRFIIAVHPRPSPGSLRTLPHARLFGLKGNSVLGMVREIFSHECRRIHTNRNALQNTFPPHEKGRYTRYAATILLRGLRKSFFRLRLRQKLVFRRCSGLVAGVRGKSSLLGDFQPPLVSRWPSTWRLETKRFPTGRPCSHGFCKSAATSVWSAPEVHLNGLRKTRMSNMSKYLIVKEQKSSVSCAGQVH